MVAIPPPLPPSPGDGYEWISILPRAWIPVSSWGKDGWDLGSWPYVIVVVYANEMHSTYAVGTYVEGDITVETYPNRDQLYEAIDKIAEFYWRSGQHSAPPDLPETGLLPHHKGPYGMRRDDGPRSHT